VKVVRGNLKKASEMNKTLIQKFRYIKTQPLVSTLNCQKVRGLLEIKLGIWPVYQPLMTTLDMQILYFSGWSQQHFETPKVDGKLRSIFQLKPKHNKMKIISNKTECQGFHFRGQSSYGPWVSLCTFFGEGWKRSPNNQQCFLLLRCHIKSFTACPGERKTLGNGSGISIQRLKNIKHYGEGE